MVELKDVLSDQDKQKMQTAVVPASSLQRAVIPNQAPEKSDIKIIRLKPKSYHIDLPVPKVSKSALSKTITKDIIKDFEIFCSDLQSGKDPKITPELLYDFFCISTKHATYLINSGYTPIYEIIWADKKFADILNSFSYQIFQNLPPEYHEIKNDIIEKYTYNIYVGARNDKKNIIFEDLESRYTSYLYFQLLNNKHFALAQGLLCKYYYKILNDVIKKDTNDELICILEKCYDVYKESCGCGIYHQTCNQIVDKIYDIFCLMVDNIDNASNVLKQIIQDQNLKSYLREYLIQHNFLNKYTECFFQFSINKVLTETILKPKIISEQKIETPKAQQDPNGFAELYKRHKEELTGSNPDS